jgi:1-deoxy-D-xylulose-5-phosphate reductoisomerase
MSSPSSAEGPGPIRIALLGSTGSIGRQALDVIERDPAFRVVALAAGSNTRLLAEQARRHLPALVATASAAGSGAVRSELPARTALLAGEAALLEIAARPDVDLLLVATGGIVSLRPVLAALERGTIVATANKETLVAGGHLVMPLARELADRAASGSALPDSALPGSALPGGPAAHPMASPLAWLRPIDSEHSAIWQCLAGEDLGSVARLILTASGGPFLDRPGDSFTEITPEDALKHPTWRMGPKITIDSATLANKGLEIIEAHWLYDVAYEAIDVAIHPQSIVHSAVQFVDGSLKAQLGTPDMRLPIQYALTYPARRASAAAAPDLLALGRLDFRAPDEGRFPALPIAREAGRLGPHATAALIAADDVAVARFLAGSLDFPGIPRLLEAAIARAASEPAGPPLDELLAIDAEVRTWAATYRPSSSPSARAPMPASAG